MVVRVEQEGMDTQERDVREMKGRKRRVDVQRVARI